MRKKIYFIIFRYWVASACHINSKHFFSLIAKKSIQLRTPFSPLFNKSVDIIFGVSFEILNLLYMQSLYN